MTIREHIMENAIVAVAHKQHPEDFIAVEEDKYGVGLDGLTNKELTTIWQMAEFVVNTLIGECEAYKELYEVYHKYDSKSALGYKTMTLYGVALETPTSCAECPVWSYCFEIHAKRNGMLPKDRRLEYCPIQEG